MGDTATFIVEAEGANLSYQWLCRAPGASNFEYLTTSDATTNTLRVEMTAQSDGAEYRCFITDANGDMGSTRVATVKLDILDWEMEYDTSGIRTKRISDGKTYSYIYAGDKLMRMTVDDDVLDFSYDANGTPLTMTYNGTVYYYITNLQGDVVSFERADGGGASSYVYDAWGNILSMSGDLAELNPLRYRGYVYDQETGFYYLNNRYYDPEIGRFINEDPYISTGKGVIGCNMFAYCNNNPVNGSDPNGLFWQELKELWSYFSSALQESRGYFATAIGVSQIDSALPGPADVASVFMIGVGVLGCAAIATRTYFTTSNKLKSQSVAKVESITKKAKKSVIFPADPNMFNPIGLVKVVRPGTKNGKLISWMDPITNVAVFRWDENISYPNGPHYHVVGQSTHYYAGDLVPEPFASRYFPN